MIWYRTWGPEFVYKFYPERTGKSDQSWQNFQVKPTMGWKSGLLVLTSNPDRDECGKKRKRKKARAECLVSLPGKPIQSKASTTFGQDSEQVKLSSLSLYFFSFTLVSE